MRLAALLLAVSALLPAALLRAAPVNLLDSGAVWYRSAGGISDARVASGVLTCRPNSLNGEMLSYFAPVSLAVGDTLTLAFTYTVTGSVNNRPGSLRIGLFDSNGGPKVAANRFDDAKAGGYTGYFVSGNPGNSRAQNAAVRFRSPSASAFLIGGSSNDPAYPASLATGGNRLAAIGVSQDGFLSITRIDADTHGVEYSLGGESVTVTYVAGPAAFDTVGVYFGRLGGEGDTTLSIRALTLDLRRP